MKNRILFIEKTPDYSDVMRYYLENNYYIAFSPSNNDALHKIEKDEKIRLIIYDNDPPALDGLAFLKTIRKNHYTIPFILLSDNLNIKSDVEIIKNTLFLNKPFQIEALIQVIEGLIPKTAINEKRKYPRISMNRNIVISDKKSGKKIEGSIENISIGGMRILLRDFIESFDDHEMEFQLGDLKLKLDKSRIVHKTKSDDNKISIGIEFVDLNDNILSVIENFIREVIMNAIITKKE